MSKRILTLAANGFEDIELIATRDILIRNGYDVDVATVGHQQFLFSSYNLKIFADLTIEQALKNIDNYYGLFIPGGTNGVLNLYKEELVFKIVKEFNFKNKYIGAICLAPTILAEAGILTNRQAVVYPTKQAQTILLQNGAKIPKLNCTYNEKCAVVIDQKIITGLNMQTTFEFAKQFVKLLDN